MSRRRSIWCITLLALAIVLTMESSVSGYYWPVKEDTLQHRIVATLGEWRPDPFHFHDGVDIAEPESTSVFPVADDTVEQTGPDWITTRNGFAYIHMYVNPDTSVVYPGKPLIERVTYLGMINSQNHLHFEDGCGSRNPLRNDGLSPFTDAAPCSIYANTVQFLRQSTGEVLSDTLHGKVDIRVRAGDRRVDENGYGYDWPAHQVCVYCVGYDILKDSTPIASGKNLVFDSNPPDDNAYFGCVYDTALSDWNAYYYLPTNRAWDTLSSHRDWYWNTKQDSGSADSVDADSIEEALFPRGNYWVKVYAFDIDSNSCAESVQVYVDNFGPRVDSVSPDSGQTEVPIGSSIEIEFDEPMDQNVGLSSVIVFSPGVSMSWQWLSSTKVRGTPQPSLEPGTDYIVTIRDCVDGDSLRDIVGHLLDGDRDGVPGGDFSWPFSTGDLDTMSGWPVPYRWETADSGLICDADWQVWSSYPCDLVDTFYFPFCGWEHSTIDISVTGSIWFDSPDTDCHFDLPSAGGHSAGVISVLNDCCTTSVWIEGLHWVWFLDSPSRYVLRWWFRDVWSNKQTSFEAVLFTNGWIRFDYEKQDIEIFQTDAGSGISCGNDTHYVQLGDVSKAAPASFTFGPNVCPGRPASKPESYPVASLGLRWPTNPENDLGGYYLYRGAGVNPDTLFKLHDSVVTDTYFVDLTVLPCSTYSYEVSAVDTHWFEGEKSDRLTGIVPPVPGACSTATSYNVGRKLVKDKESTRFYAVFTQDDSVWTTSTDCEGCLWTVPEVIGKGELPSIAVSSDNTVWVVWVGGDSNDVILYSTFADASPTNAETLFDFEGVYRFNSLSFAMDSTGYGNVVIDRYNSGGSLLYTPFYYITYLIRFSTTGDVNPWVTTIRKHEALDAHSSIDCDATNLHVAWDEGDRIFYRFGQGSGDTVVWDQPEVISQQTIPARYPCIEYSKDSVSVIWQGSVLGFYRIYHRRKGVSDTTWSSIQRVDASDDRNSVYPSIGGGTWAVWVEEVTPAAIYYSERGSTGWGTPQILKSTGGSSGFPHTVLYLGSPGMWSFTLWTEQLAGYSYGIDYERKRSSTLLFPVVGETGHPGRYAAPKVFSFAQNAPNPFCIITRMAFGLPISGHVVLDVFNVAGQRVRRLRHRYMKAGAYEVYWDGTNDRGEKAPGGTYFARLQAGKFLKTRKIVLLR